ncbi:MAG: hypothetical protein QM504_03290 [Pseudomonadota bacterium]
MKYIVLIIGFVCTYSAMSQDDRKPEENNGLTQAFTVDDVMKLEPYDAILLNKEQDIQANRYSYVVRERKIYEELKKLNEIKADLNGGKTVKAKVVKKNIKASTRNWTSVKVISIWIENNNYVGMFQIGKTKIRMSKGDSFNGYSLNYIDSNKAIVKAPKGRSIKLSI